MMKLSADESDLTMDMRFSPICLLLLYIVSIECKDVKNRSMCGTPSVVNQTREKNLKRYIDQRTMCLLCDVCGVDMIN